MIALFFFFFITKCAAKHTIARCVVMKPTETDLLNKWVLTDTRTINERLHRCAHVV